MTGRAFDDALRVRARASPDAFFVESEQGTTRFSTVDAVADRMASRLAAAGLRGSVATLLPVGPAMAAMVFAAGRAGLALTPLHRRRAPAELIDAVGALRPAAILHDHSTEDLARAVAGDRPALDLERLIGGGARANRPAEAGAASPSARDPEIQRALDAARDAARFAGVSPPDARRGERSLGAEDDAFLLWTSGTRGRSRAVRLSHANLMAVAGGSALRLDLAADDRWLATLDPAHVGGLALILRAAVVGFRLVTRERFDPAEVAALLDAGRITSASLVPTMLRQLLHERGDELAPGHSRCMLVGGDAVPRALLERALDLRYPVALTYGLTEASSQVCTAPPTLVREKPGTVGWPLKGVEIRVRQASGEILVRGPTVSAGYAGAEAPLPDRGGWLATGDVGHVDGDGHLWVMGRLSDRIITGGVNVDPAEVAARLALDHAVEEVVVVGVPDDEWGQVVAAAFVPRGQDPDLDELSKRWNEGLSSPMKPRLVRAVRELPRNPSGKVDRDAVRALFAARVSSGVRASGASR